MENTEKSYQFIKQLYEIRKDIEVLTRTKGMSQDILKESQAYPFFCKYAI